MHILCCWSDSLTHQLSGIQESLLFTGRNLHRMAWN
jgi:hypothetical protein